MEEELTRRQRMIAPAALLAPNARSVPALAQSAPPLRPVPHLAWTLFLWQSCLSPVRPLHLRVCSHVVSPLAGLWTSTAFVIREPAPCLGHKGALATMLLQCP